MLVEADNRRNHSNLVPTHGSEAANIRSSREGLTPGSRSPRIPGAACCRENSPATSRSLAFGFAHPQQSEEARIREVVEYHGRLHR